MGTLLNSESRRLYSWWWDSHISPKNSKWLQENLTEIDAKVKSMIKIINEDADSFARRAEMYYKKRPELMKLVEEFYRAYRALAERYDHATGELRLAHKTMSEVFPNQVPPYLSDDTPSSSEPTSPINPHLVRAFFESDDRFKDSDVGLSRKGLKQLNEMFQTGEAVLRELKSAEEKLMGNLPGVETKYSNSAQGLYLLSDDNQNPNAAGDAEAEMQNLKEALAKMEAERDALLFQYRESLEKLADLEKELNSVQNDAEEMGKHATEAQNEVKTLKESLAELEAERDASFNQYQESSQKVASLEATMAAGREETTKWSGRAVKAEVECQNLKEELSTLETDKQEALVRYDQSMLKISSLEEKLFLVEENAKRLNEQIGPAEAEIQVLKHKLYRLDEEKEDAYLRYHQCLDAITKLQNELMEAKEDIGRLNGEIFSGSVKLRAAEDQCALLEKMNEYLKFEADDLIQQIAEKDQQLFQKHDDLEKLMSCLQDEESRFAQVEASLSSLQNLHSQSQEEQRSLASELKNGLQMLKDLELCKRDLEHLREENRGLNDLKLASCVAQRDMEHEISSLKEIKEKLESEARKQAEQNDALQRQADRLKEEIKDLHRKYWDLLQEVESAGIDPKCVGSFIEDLRNEYTRLKEVSAEEKDEKEALLKKLEDMEGLLERSAVLERSLSDMNIELERSKEKTKALQECCDSLSAEKLSLVAEKSALLSQLQMITETIQGLLEKNASLENSLSCANVELEGLRVKSKSLEDVCQLLSNEKLTLESERSSLTSQLQLVQKNVESIETRFGILEGKYAGLEKDKESTRSQVEELRTSFGAEKQERARLLLTSEARFSGLDGRIEVLQEESKCRKKEFEEQLEKAVNAQVEIFILQKFIQDMEEKNYSLIAECQKHAVAAKYSEKVISELEGENMMQHLEMEFLLDRVDKLRRGIFQVMKAVEILDHVNEAEPELFLPGIAGTIKGIRKDLVEGRDENQQLLIQNTVLSAVIRQLSSEGSELAARKEVLHHEFLLLGQKHVVLEHEKDELLERNAQLDAAVDVKEREQEIAEAQMEAMSLKQQALHKECAALQETHSDVLEANRCLQGKLCDFEEENRSLVEENSAAIVEALRFSNESAILQSSWVEKALELEVISKELNHLREAYCDSENNARALREKLGVKEVENVQLAELIQKLEEKNQQLSVFNDQLNHRFVVKGEQLNHKEMELFGAEQRIKALQDANTELHTTVEGLQMHSEGLQVIRGSLEQRISELSRYKEHAEKEIVSLHEANNILESDLELLNQEMEACKIREAILSSELHERSCEFELWEAEASSFYFDLQTCAVREAVYEDKVHELSEGLEGVTIRSSVERETMTDKISFLEGEKEGLKSHLAAYLPAIASLKNNIVSLEQNPLLQTRFCSPGTPQRQQEITVRDASSSAPDGLSELQDLQSRIEAIEAAVEYKIGQRAESKPYGTPEHGNGAHMKDIQLDYVPDAPPSSNKRRGDSDKFDPMLELWETAEQDTDSRAMGLGEIQKELGVDKLEVPNSGGGTEIIVERLASDAQKLERLNASVQELKRKLEIGKKRTSSKAFEYERLRGQLQEMDDSVAQLANVNTELTKAIDKSPRSSSGIIDPEQGQKRNASEQATKEGEKIQALQLDVQKIQYIVLKLEDEKKEKKGKKSRFMRSRTGIVFKELFIFGRGRKGGKLKQRFCGCFRPSSHKQV